MNEDELVAALSEAWERNGGESATQSALSAHLRDRLGSEASSSVHLLVSAFADGVPQRIKKTGPALWAVNRTVIAKSFSEQSGVALDRAQWAVDVWARALSDGALSTNETVPRPTTPDAPTAPTPPREEQIAPPKPAPSPRPRDPSVAPRNWIVAIVVLAVLIAGAMWWRSSAHNNQYRTDILLGDEARKNGDYQGAVNAYQSAINIDPKSFDAWYGKGVALGNLKQYGDSIAALQTAVSLNDKSSDAYDWLGYAFDQQNKTTNALNAYKQAITIDPNDGYALTGASNVARELKQDADAEQYGARASKAKPSSTTAWGAYCRGAYVNASYKAAYIACSQAITLHSDDALVYSDYAWAMLRGKHPVTFSKLMSLYKTSIKTDGTIADAYAGLGVIDFCQQNFETAVSRFEEAKKRASNWSDLTSWLAAAQREYGMNGTSSTMSVTERYSSDDLFASIYGPFCTKIDIHE